MTAADGQGRDGDGPLPGSTSEGWSLGLRLAVASLVGIGAGVVWGIALDREVGGFAVIAWATIAGALVFIDTASWARRLIGLGVALVAGAALTETIKRTYPALEGHAGLETFALERLGLGPGAASALTGACLYFLVPAGAVLAVHLLFRESVRFRRSRLANAIVGTHEVDERLAHTARAVAALPPIDGAIFRSLYGRIVWDHFEDAARASAEADAVLEIAQAAGSPTHDLRNATVAAWVIRGLVAFQNGATADALRATDEAVELLPEVPTLYLERAVARFASGNRGGAKADLDKAESLVHEGHAATCPTCRVDRPTRSLPLGMGLHHHDCGWVIELRRATFAVCSGDLADGARGYESAIEGGRADGHDMTDVRLEAGLAQLLSGNRERAVAHLEEVADARWGVEPIDAVMGALVLTLMTGERERLTKIADKTDEASARARLLAGVFLGRTSRDDAIATVEADATASAIRRRRARAFVELAAAVAAELGGDPAEAARGYGAATGLPVDLWSVWAKARLAAVEELGA